MLDGFLRRLVKADKPPEVIASTPHDIDSQRRRFPAIKWIAPSDGPYREEQIRSADVWLGLGGTPFQLSSGPWMLDFLEREREVCLRLHKPMVFLGVGCESPAAVLDSRGRRVIEAAERIWTRDERSADAIGRVAAGGVVSMGSDLAHIAMSGAKRPALETGSLGLVLGLDRPGIVDMVAVEQEIARRLPARTRWMVQEGRSFPCTERWNYAALAVSTRDSVELMAMNYGTDTIEEFLGEFGAPETVLSSRYHGALIAGWHGSRVGVIARTEKLNGIATDFGLPSVRLVRSAQELEALAREALSVERSRLEALADRADRMCDAFFRWLRAT